MLILSACKLNDPEEDEKIKIIGYEYDKLFASNSVYKELRSKFPEDYEPLTSNCDRLVEYYKSIQ